MAQRQNKLSSVEFEAHQRESRRNALITQYDQKREQAGFEMGKPGADGKIVRSIVGMTGEEFEEYCLRTMNQRKIERRHARDFPDISDEEAITKAIQRSPLASRDVYSQREFYFSEWMNDVYEHVQNELFQRGLIQDSLSKGAILQDLVKIVPCLQNEMDLHRGIDAMIIFHDPNTSQQQLQDPTYWNAERDTLVTIDVCGYLGAKFGYASRDHKALRADVFASKTESATNNYINHALEKQGATPLPQRLEVRGGRKYEDRMKVLAQRIVDVYEAKSGRMGTDKLRHIRNPEAEKKERLALQQQEARTKAEKAIKRSKREKKKDEENKKKGDEAKEAAAARRGANVGVLPEDVAEVYRQKRELRRALIKASKQGGRKGKEILDKRKREKKERGNENT